MVNRFIIKERSTQLLNWGRYNMYKFEDEYYITKRSHVKWNSARNTKKEMIVINVPKYLMCEILRKKHIDNRYIKKIRNVIAFYKIEENKKNEQQIIL